MQTEQPSPENVSNEGEPIAQLVESSIVNEGAQGETEQEIEVRGSSDRQKVEDYL